MSINQSNRSNLSLPSTSDTKDRLSHANSETDNISTKQIAKIVLLTIVSVSLIVIGSMYMKQCPVGAYIPVYLLVTGLMGLLKALLSLRTGVPSDPSEQTVLRQALMANSSKSASLINFDMVKVWRSFVENDRPKNVIVLENQFFGESVGTSTELQSADVGAKYTTMPTKLKELYVHSWLHIISFLDVLDTINLAKTSRLMKSIAKQSYIRFSHISFGESSVDVSELPLVLEEIGDDVRSVVISGLNVRMLDCLLKCCPNLTELKLIDSSNILNSMPFGKYLPLLKNITNLEIRKSGIYYSKMNRAKRFQNIDSLLATLTEIDTLNSLKIDYIETGDKTFHHLKSIKNLKCLHLNRYLATVPVPPIIPNFLHLKEYLFT
ncbi:uncharacterized protein LOC119080056 [Bradysia coprophila]|uniref:uncharacterized protein LOC119080056 n=1 Tax=Bradysia coprophila TaxID=38358 RepID=UPI00187D74FA|nr:uncharacterized protein LOC119080056 [Bradysia coprophila]